MVDDPLTGLARGVALDGDGLRIGAAAQPFDGDRAAAGPDLQAPPAVRNATRLELTDRARVEDRLEQAESFGGFCPDMVRRPSEYFKDHCFVAPFPEENLDRVVEAVGVKPIVFGSLAHQELPARTLILAHRDELLTQARDKIASITGFQPGLEKGRIRASATDPIVVASVQSLMRGRSIAAM